MEFKNKDIEQQYLERLEDDRQVLEDNTTEEESQFIFKTKPNDVLVADTYYLWDEMAQKYEKMIEQIKRALGHTGFKEYEFHLPDKLESFLMQYTNPEFQIVLVGVKGAGKSTLINALLGYELAPTRVTPETAVLTRFRCINEYSVKVVFYNDDEWNRLQKSVQKVSNSIFMEDYEKLEAKSVKDDWIGHDTQKIKLDGIDALKEEIEKWTSSRSPVHYFVKEVTVNLKDFDLPEGVVLVDTPGLDDVVEFRSDITRNYIDRANAVLVCNKCAALTKGELETLCRVFDNAPGNAEKIYVVATQLDNLNDPKGDWKKQSDEWTKYLKGKGCYGSEDLARKNILPVSAHFYTLLKDYKKNLISREANRYSFRTILIKLGIEDEFELNENFQDLIEFTNIKKLRRKIKEEIVVKQKGILIENLKARYNSVGKTIREEDVHGIQKQRH